MQKNVQINADVFIEDLGTGHSYVNFDRRVEEVTDQQIGGETPPAGHSAIIAAEQYRVKNPATRARIIDTVIQANYPDGEDAAALRKGIVDANNPDFIAFNAFVEGIKVKCATEGIGQMPIPNANTTANRLTELEEVTTQVITELNEKGVL